MSGCGCSKETPCEDKKSQQENHPSIAEANNSKNCDNIISLKLKLHSTGKDEQAFSLSPERSSTYFILINRPEFSFWPTVIESQKFTKIEVFLDDNLL